MSVFFLPSAAVWCPMQLPTHAAQTQSHNVICAREDTQLYCKTGRKTGQTERTESKTDPLGKREQAVDCSSVNSFAYSLHGHDHWRIITLCIKKRFF